jgi:Amidase
VAVYFSITSLGGLVTRSVLRAEDLMATHSKQLNDYIHWHVEKGRKLRGPDLSRVEAKRTAPYQQLCNLKGEYEFFILPVNQVLPFDVNQHYPTEIPGMKMENYMEWMKSAYYISAAGNPAIAVPCGFSASGLPIGLQIVGTAPRRMGRFATRSRIRGCDEGGRAAAGGGMRARGNPSLAAMTRTERTGNRSCAE